MVVKAQAGPIPFPDMSERARAIEHRVRVVQAEIEAYRSMAALGGSSQWPQIKAGLSQQLAVLMERLIVEKDREEVIRLQERVKVHREILAAPEAAEREIEARGRQIETLRKQLEATIPPKA